MIPTIIAAPEVRDFSSYCEYLWGFVLDMFRWDCEFIPGWAIERALTTHGTAGIFYNDGKPVVAIGGYTGTPTQYEFGDTYHGTDFAGTTYTGKIGEDVAVLWNNLTLSSDRRVVSAYAERYVESDKSILNVLRGTRITNLVVASDNTDKATLDRVTNAIKDGETVVKVPPVFREIDALDNGVKRFDVMRLTDPKDTDKLQYLCRFRDDLLAAFLNEYGIDVNVVNKGSQVSKDELHSMERAVSATVQQRLECRQRNLDVVRGWGFKIDVAPNIGRTNGKESETNDTISDSATDESGLDTNADSE